MKALMRFYLPPALAVQRGHHMLLGITACCRLAQAGSVWGQNLSAIADAALGCPSVASKVQGQGSSLGLAACTPRSRHNGAGIKQQGTGGQPAPISTELYKPSAKQASASACQRRSLSGIQTPLFTKPGGMQHPYPACQISLNSPLLP